MHHRYNGHHFMDFFGNFSWFGLLLFGLAFLIIVILIITGIFLLIRYSKKEQQRFTSNRSLEILQERFAKGEIDEDEYRRRKEVLEEELNR